MIDQSEIVSAFPASYLEREARLRRQCPRGRRAGRGVDQAVVDATRWLEPEGWLRLHKGYQPGTAEAAAWRVKFPPSCFIAYRSSDDFGQTWKPILSGMPRTGQWGRRTRPRGTCHFK
jgi:hypothetical protein